MKNVVRHLAYGSTILLASFAFSAWADGMESIRQGGKGPAVANTAPRQAGLTDAQMAEANARLDLAKMLVERVESNAKAMRLGEGWKGDAMRQLLPLRSEQLKALMSNSASATYSGLVAAAKDARIPESASTFTTKALGDLDKDLVFFPIVPCRNADTRNAGGPITGGTFRDFNADAGASQGGTAGCFVVAGTDASAWALNITVVNMSTTGFVAVRSVGSSAQTSLVNYTGPGQQVNNFVIVNNSRASSVNEYEVYAATTVDVIIDLFGYFLSPNATALQCTIVSSAVTSVPVNAWTAVDASCPSGYSATGGGFDTTEGTLGYPGVWTTHLPVSSTTWRTWVDNQTSGARNIQTFTQCCRVPGR